ncbi:MAG: hypothetical protein ACKVP4_03075 [Hyphomicrobium sp.]
MPLIALIAVAAVILLDLLGAIPNSSVGGPMTLMLLFVLAMLAMGLYEAWSEKRGAPGWIVSIVAAIVGGFAGASVAGMALEMIIPWLQLDGSLAASQHIFRYVASPGMMLLTLFGSWIGLWIANRFR